MHTHQANPAIKATGDTTLQRFILPKIPFWDLPVHFFFQPQSPAFRLRFFLLALLLPVLN